MGKACVRFRKLDDLPLELIGEVVTKTPVAEYIASYEETRARMRKTARRGAKPGRRSNAALTFLNRDGRLVGRPSLFTRSPAHAG